MIDDTWYTCYTSDTQSCLLAEYLLLFCVSGSPCPEGIKAAIYDSLMPELEENARVAAAERLKEAMCERRDQRWPPGWYAAVQEERV